MLISRSTRSGVAPQAPLVPAPVKRTVAWSVQPSRSSALAAATSWGVTPVGEVVFGSVMVSLTPDR